MNPNYFGRMHFTIRYGMESDATALAELAARTFKETFGAGTGDEDMASYLAEAYGRLQQEQELVGNNILDTPARPHDKRLDACAVAVAEIHPGRSCSGDNQTRRVPAHCI
jgi:hypothetical protein